MASRPKKYKPLEDSADTPANPAPEAAVNDNVIPPLRAYTRYTEEDEFRPGDVHHFKAKIEKEIIPKLNLAMENREAESRTPFYLNDADSGTSAAVRESNDVRLESVKLQLAKARQAMQDIAVSRYGYCRVTREPISLSRLEANPLANVTEEVQAALEIPDKAQREARLISLRGPRAGQFNL